MSINKKELFPGLAVYSGVLPESMDLVNRLENAIQLSNKRKYWQQATVNSNNLYLEHRDCFDIKLKKNNKLYKTQYDIELDSIWQDVYDAQVGPVEEYTSRYKIKMNYWEAMNFIKYNKGQYFTEHSDHGNSYVCTVSLVSYLNDNYEGGELYFNNLGITIKPKAGDMIIFPSSYLFSHTAFPVKNGIKYSIATMLDYNDNNKRSNYEKN